MPSSRKRSRQQYSFPNIIGKNDRMLRILDLVTQVAPSRATILITGETGTGKELIAKGIHANSARADQPFVPVNSGSVPSELLESALFGHVKGAFTGAITSRKGYFETANNGTIFFDEIGTISPETQAKLLRVIQEREFMPVGSAETIKVDVRIIAATNAELKEAGGRRQISRGPVLSAERDQSGAAAAAGSQGRYSAPGGTFSNEVQPRKRKVPGSRRPEPVAVRAGRACSS